MKKTGVNPLFFLRRNVVLLQRLCRLEQDKRDARVGLNDEPGRKQEEVHGQ